MKTLCVTPNAAVDRTLTVPRFAATGVWRAEAVRVACGGKGVNVARALRCLGQQAVCAGLLAGHTGRLAAGSAEAEGLEAVWTWIEGESRTCVIVVGGPGHTTVINEPGASVTERDWGRLASDVRAAASRADAVAISGSLPPGTPAGGLAEIVAVAAGAGSRRPVWVDTSGPALKEALTAGPAGVKINADEAGQALGEDVKTVDQAIAAAKILRGRCDGAAAITLGSAGAVLAIDEGVWRCRPPAIDEISAVGSGDSFLAGLLAGVLEGRTPAEALRLAVAAGAATALAGVAGRVDPRDVTRLMAGTEVALASQG